ncbi:efflux RND transporter permease subunit [candidate division KSB1 bacterium]|nr:efflux RND transporter permease subunit [candidate division KSB1 bacterium]
MIGHVLHRPVTVAMGFICLIILAVFSLTQLPIELSSEIDFPQLSVQIYWPNASAEMVERSITTLAEQAAATVNGVKKISSTSSEGLSRVDIIFQKNTDMDLARLELSEKIAALRPTLPHDAHPGQIQKYIPKEFADLQGFMSYQLYASEGTAFLQHYGRQAIRPALLVVKGVANVEIKGGAEREIVMVLDEGKLNSMQVSLDQVLQVVRQAQSRQSIGRSQQDGIIRYVSVGEALYQLDDLLALWLPGRSQGGRPLSLSEFCTVKDTLAEPASIVRINGRSAVTIDIDKEPGINMLKTARAVEAAVEQLRRSFPPGLSMEKVIDRSSDIRAEINELTGKSLFSALFVLGILLLFFRSMRLSFIVFLSVIFSIAGAVIFLAATRIGLNVITLSAMSLSFGVIVDNAVVIFENIQRQFDIAPELTPLENIKTGAMEMRLPLFAATVTTIGALVPVVFLPENLRAYFVQFAWTAAVALIFSYLVAMTFIPTASLWHHRSARKKNVSGSPIPQLTQISTHAKRLYRELILWNLQHRKFVIILSILLLGVPFWLLPGKINLPDAVKTQNEYTSTRQIKRNAAQVYNIAMDNPVMRAAKPYLDHLLGGASHLFFKYVYKGELWKMGFDTYIVVYARAPQGTELRRLDAYSRQIEDALAKNQAVVRRYTTRIHTRTAYIRVDFDRRVAMTAVPVVIKDQLTALVAGTSGFTVGVSGFGPGFYSGGGMMPNYTIQILGYNYTKVKELAQNIAGILSRNARVADIQMDRLPWQEAEYQLVGKVDREALFRHGIGLEEFLNSLASKLRRGIHRQRVMINEEEINFSTHLNQSAAAELGKDPERSVDLDVRTLLNASTRAGRRMVRIGDVLHIELQPVMAEIKRENQQYTRIISYNFKGPSRLGNRYLEAVLKSIQPPVGYQVKQPDYGFFFGRKESIPMILIAVVSLAIVFMVTASLFESLRRPFVILLSVPMSLTGLFLGFYLFDINFGRGGYAALILLIGLSVNNGIILISRMAQLTGAGGSNDRFQAIVDAVVQRTRPILITTLTTVAGFAPFVVSADVYSFWYAFAFAVIYGLAFSTVMILLVMPALFDALYKENRQEI